MQQKGEDATKRGRCNKKGKMQQKGEDAIPSHKKRDHMESGCYEWLLWRVAAMCHMIPSYYTHLTTR